jgi:multiple sugar transport system permease protein
MRLRLRSIVPAAARHAVLLGTTALVLLPFVWMLSLSLKPPAEIFESAFRLFPRTFYAAENYGEAFRATPMMRFMANGVFVCGATLLFQIATSAPLAYALAKLRFRGSRAVFALVLVGILIPHQVLAVPLFVLFHRLGVLDSYAGLILPSVVSPFAIFLLRQFFKTVPDDLIQAARLDGLNELSIVFRIMLPLAKPVLAAFAILSVVVHWNDLFWPSIVIRTQELATPPLGVVFFRNIEAGSSYGPMMAGAVIIVTPLLVAFLAAQRWFIEGLAAGSMK